MAKTTATKTKSATAQAPVENVVVSESAPSEKKVKKVKSSASKESVVSTPEPVVEPVASSSVPVEGAVAVEVENSLMEMSMEFTAQLHQVNNMLTSLKSKFKNIEKSWAKELKASQKLNSKKKRKSGNRAPSGFVKPAPITDELAKFLNKPVGTEMARTDVTKEINAYIRAHKLQDPKNGRTILPDKKLSTLLKLQPSDHLSFFNLQKFITVHFPKSPKAVKATEAVAGGSA